MDTNVKPLLSVIMPVYNAAPFVKEAIQSILNQTYSNFEFIIINDGSTDNSLDVIQSIHDERIKLVSNETNLGIIKTRNKALAMASGKYVAKMDADDVSLPTRFEKQIQFLESNPNVAVLATKLALINEKGEPIGMWHEDEITSSNEEIYNLLPIINCVGQPTMMMRADIVKPIAYNLDYTKNEDWGLWLDVIAKGHIISKLDEVLVNYRIHSTSTTVTANRESVHKKIIRFKKAYCKNNFKRILAGKVERRVFISLLSDCFKLIFRPTYHFIQKLRKAELPSVFVQCIKFQWFCWFAKKPRHYFFFPFCHIGGAERVHLSIVETISDKKPVVFLTSFSEVKALLPEFKKHSRLVEVDHILRLSVTKKWFTKKIVKVASNNDTIFFSSNSKFFYDSIPVLPKSLRLVDLVHAFMHDNEDGSEKWSLPNVSRFWKRIVISKNTINDFKKLYERNGVELKYVNDIKCITNFVDEVDMEKVKLIEPFKVIYVGRGSYEKRIHLIAQAAAICSEKGLPVSFYFIGDVSKAIPNDYLKYCNLLGEIADVNVLRKHYSESLALIISSSREGFPMVIMEAMMQGVIPITTNVGGIAQHVIHNETGLLISETDESDIVNKIVENLQYLCSSEQNRNLISNKAIVHAKTNFGKQLFFDSYRELLLSK